MPSPEGQPPDFPTWEQHAYGILIVVGGFFWFMRDWLKGFFDKPDRADRDDRPAPSDDRSSIVLRAAEAAEVLSMSKRITAMEQMIAEALPILRRQDADRTETIKKKENDERFADLERRLAEREEVARKKREREDHDRDEANRRGVT